MEEEQGYYKKIEMQSLLGHVTGWREKCLEKDMEAKSAQVQRMHQRTASTQVRHNKVDKMGTECYAVISQEWEVRRRHGHPCEITQNATCAML